MAALSAIRNIGTAARRDTGASGAAVPVLNVANDWSGQQRFGAGALVNAGQTLAFDGGGALKDYRWGVDTDGQYLKRFSADGVTDEFTYAWRNDGTFRVGGNAVWHAGNMGPGSTLNADLVDGLHASAFGQLAIANTWAAAQTFNASARFNANPEVPAGIYTRYGLTGSNDWYLGKPNATDLYLYRDAGVAWIMNGSGLEIVLGSLVAKLRAGTEASGILTRAGSANRFCKFTGNVTINDGVFQGDDIISGYNNTASTITVTPGVGVTMRLGGTTTTGARTVLPRGRFEIAFDTGSVCVVQGAVT